MGEPSLKLEGRLKDGAVFRATYLSRQYLDIFAFFLYLLGLMDYFFTPASAEHQKREKAKARELRLSQWWKQELGKGACYHCQNHFKPAELTMDHLIPIARGGKSNKNNCVPSCKDCNTKKGYKTRAEMALEELKKPDFMGDSDDSDDQKE